MAGRGLIEHASHPEEGDIPQIVNPLALSGLARRHRPHAPDVGDANNDVLNALGFDADAIGNLIKNGVI